MRPWRIHFGGEINVKNNEIPETSTEKGGKNVQRGPGACTSIQGPGTYHMKDTFDNQPRTNLRRGLLKKGRDNEGQMRRSHASSVLLRRATSAAPAQRKNYRYSPTSSRWDHKKEISHLEDPQTG